MSYWLLKTDPETYSIEELARDVETTWDGVSNPQALGFLRRMKRGDRALIYHSGRDKAIVGSCKVVGDARPAGSRPDEKPAVVDVQYLARAAAPVPLSKIKSDPAFADFLLVRQSRLSVMPVTASQWKTLTEWAGLGS